MADSDKVTDKESLLKKLCAYAFAAYDWNLYLDTHPYDSEAIAMFRKTSDKAEELKQEFQKEYGALTADSEINSEVWKWICDPWPWENI